MVLLPGSCGGSFGRREAGAAPPPTSPWAGPGARGGGSLLRRRAHSAASESSGYLSSWRRAPALSQAGGMQSSLSYALQPSAWIWLLLPWTPQTPEDATRTGCFFKGTSTQNTTV